MHIRIWGVRGSIPTPRSQPSRYGGNTPCVELFDGGDDLLIMDAGSGIFPLGEDIIKREKQPRRVHIFLSHLHWDHIQGLPFFTPAFSDKYEVHVYAPRDISLSSETLLEMQRRYCGFRLIEPSPYRVTYHDLDEGQIVDIGAFRLRTMFLNHPALDFGYRVEVGGKVFCYCTDLEPCAGKLLREGITPEQVRSGEVTRERAIFHRENLNLVSFISNSDLYIQDSMFTKEQYLHKIGWGHSPYDFSLEVAYVASVKTFVMFHFAPDYDDETLDEMWTGASRLAENFRHPLEVLAAQEGMILEL